MRLPLAKGLTVKFSGDHICRKRTGYKTVLWGSPEETGTGLDTVPSTRTHSRFKRKSCEPLKSLSSNSLKL